MDDWWRQPCQAISEPHVERARARQAQLTKPPGSLGRLEDLAVQLAGLQATDRPSLERVQVVVFAADHGIAEEGVSAFPQAVTCEMVRNFARGGAAINVLAQTVGAALEVIDVGTALAPEDLAEVRSERIAAGTANFAQQAAMRETQLAQALGSGRDAVSRARDNGAQLLIGGEMGIANTSAATALACVLLQRPAAELTGPGTGLNAKGVYHKAAVIDRALDLHGVTADQPLVALRHVGGFEIAALVGTFIAAAQNGLPVLVDGFIASVAALTATRINPSLADWLLYAHRSAEPGHARVLEALAAQPLLDLGMRLGEGSGAAVALPLLRQALALHNRMATFAEAGVSEGAD